MSSNAAVLMTSSETGDRDTESVVFEPPICDGRKGIAVAPRAEGLQIEITDYHADGVVIPWEQIAQLLQTGEDLRRALSAVRESEAAIPASVQIDPVAEERRAVINAALEKRWRKYGRGVCRPRENRDSD